MVARNSGSDTKGLISTFQMDVADMPAWAIEESCTAFRRGDVGDGKWLPTPGELRKDCRMRLSGVRGEIERIRRILTATIEDDTPPDPERRAKLVALLSKTFNPKSTEKENT